MSSSWSFFRERWRALVDGVPRFSEALRDLVDLEPLEEAQARCLAVSLGERAERALEVIAGLGFVEWSRSSS